MKTLLTDPLTAIASKKSNLRSGGNWKERSWGGSEKDIFISSHMKEITLEADRERKKSSNHVLFGLSKYLHL